MQAIVEVIGMMAVGVASNTLYDLIKEVLLSKGVTKRTEMLEVTQPDGTRLVVVMDLSSRRIVGWALV